MSPTLVEYEKDPLGNLCIALAVEQKIENKVAIEFQEGTNGRPAIARAADRSNPWFNRTEHV